LSIHDIVGSPRILWRGVHRGSFSPNVVAGTDDGVKREYLNQPFWTAHASLPGLPAVAAPIGRTPGGLPVGAQIIGPLHEHDTALTFAELLGDSIGGYEAPPGG
jgi:amidase